jgi:hypothetical protein
LSFLSLLFIHELYVDWIFEQPWKVSSSLWAPHTSLWLSKVSNLSIRRKETFIRTQSFMLLHAQNQNWWFFSKHFFQARTLFTLAKHRSTCRFYFSSPQADLVNKRARVVFRCEKLRANGKDRIEMCTSAGWSDHLQESRAAARRLSLSLSLSVRWRRRRNLHTKGRHVHAGGDGRGCMHRSAATSPRTPSQLLSGCARKDNQSFCDTTDLCTSVPLLFSRTKSLVMSLAVEKMKNQISPKTGWWRTFRAL